MIENGFVLDSLLQFTELASAIDWTAKDDTRTEQYSGSASVSVKVNWLHVHSDFGINVAG